MSEQCKSLATGSSESGLGLLFGGVPLVVVHTILMIVLLAVALRNHRQRFVGALLAVAVVVIASGVGIAVNELIWAGQLFSMSASQADCLSVNP